MLSLPASVRIDAATAPCDMRKQIDGLAALVEQELGHKARSGDLFVAFNRRGDMVRILFWDATGHSRPRPGHARLAAIDSRLLPALGAVQSLTERALPAIDAILERFYGKRPRSQGSVRCQGCSCSLPSGETPQIERVGR